jgi:hypothetical protein
LSIAGVSGSCRRSSIEGGCIAASLDTYSFQEQGLYEKLGYSRVGTIEDCPPGGAGRVPQKRFAGPS